MLNKWIHFPDGSSVEMIQLVNVTHVFYRRAEKESDGDEAFLRIHYVGNDNYEEYKGKTAEHVFGFFQEVMSTNYFKDS